MRKFPVVLTFLIILSLAVFSSCEGLTGSTAAGSIRIVDVTPVFPLAGTPVDITVTVDFSLIGAAEGEIYIAFNTGSSPTAYIPAESFIVGENSDNPSFTVHDVTPKDWYVNGQSYDFVAYVVLVDLPNGSPLAPVDTDIFVIDIGV